MLIRVSTPLGESVIVEKVYRSCLVTFVRSNTHVDLVILELVDFRCNFGYDLAFSKLCNLRL